MSRPADPTAPDIRGREPIVQRARPRHTEPGHSPEPIATGCISKPTLSDRALEVIDGPRADSYGAPADNLARIGACWAAMLGLPEPIPAFRVALMMAALKAVRAAHQPTDDSLVDLVGYGELAERLRP